MRYKNYIFDLYGTLVDIRTDEWSAQLWKKMAILYGYYGAAYTYKELGKAYGELVDKEKKAVRRRHPEYEVIDIKIEKVFRALFTRKGVKPKKATVPEVCEVFRCFSTKYIKLYDGVTELLDTIKANGGWILFDRYGLKKEESVMVGNDYLSDIGGAADFGIDSVYIHQSISPEIKGELRSNFTVMDGDVHKITQYFFA